MKTIIGILPSFDEENNQIFLKQPYVDEITNSGGIPFIIPLSSDPKNILEIINVIDGLIFSGGSDIDPKYYGETNSGKSLGISNFRDKCEKEIIRIAIEADIPILGICRGMQALNVFCGGSLIQDIPSEFETSLIHNLIKPDIAFHKVSIEKSSPLSEIMGFGEHVVNSYHHQAVKDVAPEFSVCATAEDGIVEAIYHRNKKFVLGVQWHPERDHTIATENKNIIDSFVKICSK